MEEAKGENARLRSQIELLSKSVAMETSAKSRAISQIEILENNVDCCEKKLACLQDLNRSTESEKMSLSIDHARLQEELVSVRCQLNDREKSNRLLTGQIEKSREAIDAHSAKIRQLSEREQRLEAQVTKQSRSFDCVWKISMIRRTNSLNTRGNAQR